MKKTIPAILISLAIFGCGMTSKDTVDTQPAVSTQIYALTDKGLSIGENNGKKWGINIQKSKTNQIISSVFNDVILINDKLLIATDRGLAIASANGVYNNYLEDIPINSLTVDGLDIYLATSKGTYVSTSNYQFTQINQEKIEQVQPYGSLIYASSGKNILVCTNNVFEWSVHQTLPETIEDFDILGGTLYVQTNKGLYINDEKCESLLASSARALFIDKTKKAIWIATDKGLQKSGDSGKTWVVFDKASGLDTLDIDSILVDNLNIYLGTPGGLIHSINAGETWKTYKKQHGLLSGKILKVILRK